jgi:serine/threonine protein kinase
MLAALRCAEQVVVLVLDLASGGELFDFIAYPKEKFPEQVARCLFKQVSTLSNCL